MPEVLGETWVRLIIVLVVGITSILLVHRLSGSLVRLLVRPPRWLDIESIRPAQEDTRFIRRLTTLERFTARAYTTIAITAMVLYLMYLLDLRLYGILAGAGILGIAVAFGAQTLIRDAISGIFILIENPYDIGDFVRLNAVEGEVAAISLRHTTLLADDGSTHTIPNGAITLTTNFTRDAAGHSLVLRLAASVPQERVMQVLEEVERRLAEAPEVGPRLQDGPRVGGVVSFRSDSYEIEIRSHVHRSLRRTWPVILNRQLQRAFAEAGIEVL